MAGAVTPIANGDESAGSSVEHVVDVVVLGAGVGGMVTALFAAIRGLDVVVLEKAETVGGTTALSAGTAWIPGTVHAASVNPHDDREAAEIYLQGVVGARLDPAKLGAFLENGPPAIAELDARTEVKFRARPHHPDYRSEIAGSTLCGRALEPLPFDGRKLGPLIAQLRLPLRELTLLGMMVGADDIRHLLHAGRALPSTLHALRLLARHAVDRLRFGRGTRLLMGNALCARLLYSLHARNVPVWTATSGSELLLDGERVCGVIARRGDRTFKVFARRGVVLATGGFAHSAGLKERLLPHPIAQYTATPREVAGDGIEFGLGRGGTLPDSYDDGSFWAPVSVRRQAGGETSVYPHFFLDRGKPGFIAVNQAGHRFVNEATSYDAFVRAMYATNAQSPAVPCLLIADARAVRRYGMGLVLPGGYRLRRLLAEGYLKRADTLEDLARLLGIDPRVLQDTVSRFNGFGATGCDRDFHRGETAANLVLGDTDHGPNACLGPIEISPFYALELHPAMNGTSAGLVTDVCGRVLTKHGGPIVGLYASGNDMASLMAGTYPGPGTTIGPAIAFSYLIANDLLRKDNEK